MKELEKKARKFLRHMIKVSGFIADGVYEEHPRLWKSNNRHSTTMMDLGVFGFLRRQGYIQRDNSGRYLITEKGAKFAQPWWKRIFYNA